MSSDVLKLVFAYCFSPLPGFQLYVNISVIWAEISGVLLSLLALVLLQIGKTCLRPLACAAMVLTSVRLQWCSS